MTTGSCLCGKVRWRVDGGFTEMLHCHCSRCRKAHGTAFATWAATTPSGLHWLAGSESVCNYQSSPAMHRSFCRHCGSVVPSVAGDGVAFVPVGCLDEDPGVRPGAHIFVASGAPWFRITDMLPRHAGYPAGSELPEIPASPQSAATAGILRGSCLCATVAFHVTPPFVAVRNCHCMRCRKARAAAHATNGFTDAAGLEFVHGESELVQYKVPGARYFTQVFCRHCGSAMPRVDRERGIAVIPFGALDDDPGRGIDVHIFVDFKAPWYDISDDLPRFPGSPA